MATSGSATAAINKNHQLLFEWSRSSYSNTENYSVIKWTLTLDALTAYGSINSSNSRSWSVTVNGTKYSGTNTVGVSTGGSKTLASGSTKIYHSSWNTAKSFSYSFSQEMAVTLSGTYYRSEEQRLNSSHAT